MRVKQKPSTLAVAVLVGIGVAWVVVASQSATPYSVETIGTVVVVGAALGGIYAITACGLVVTYATTGVFNFAHAAIGAFLAFLYWQLSVGWGWPTLLALAVVLLVVAPLLGVLLDVVLMRRLRRAPLVVQLVVTVGLMLAFMGLTTTIWKPATPRATPFLVGGGVEVAGITATWHRVITVALAAGLAVFLRWFLYRTRLGISMRAVVDSRDLAALTGARSSVVSGASWSLGAMTAGLAGILIAPETGMEVERLTLIIVTAFAAAAIAQMRSIPLAFLGGMIIGLAKSYTAVFLSFGTDWSYVPEAIPAVILLVAVLFLPDARLETGSVRVTKRTERLTRPGEALVGAAGLVGVVVVWANGWIPFPGASFGERSEIWLGRGAGFLVLGLIMLSLVPLIGWAGQVSFANYAIAGIGALLFSHLGGQDGDPVAVVLVMLVCAPLGALVALPALRVKGLYLALATMAFAEIADKVIVRHPNLLDPTVVGSLYQPLELFGVELSSDAAHREAFVVFLAIVFAVGFFLLTLLRRSRWARSWIAINDSPAASATIGVNITTSKIAVFALSGAMAGFAGCMLGLSSGSFRADSFPLFAGLPLVLLLAAQGVRYPVAAFTAAVALASFPALYELLGEPSWLSSIELIGPGIAAIAMAYRPEGTVFYAGRNLAARLPWRTDAKEDKAMRAAKLRAEDITRDEINDLGLTRPFTPDTVARLDRALGITDDVPIPGDQVVSGPDAATPPDREQEVRGAAPVG
jgi:branched-chain amino acid transport system permease protein